MSAVLLPPKILKHRAQWHRSYVDQTILSLLALTSTLQVPFVRGAFRALKGLWQLMADDTAGNETDSAACYSSIDSRSDWQSSGAEYINGGG